MKKGEEKTRKTEKMLYHEVQELRLCGMHCINTVLQGPFFSESDLAKMAFELDRIERQLMSPGVYSPELCSSPLETSHNISPDGDFSIQVLQKAMEVLNLQVIPLDSPVGEVAQTEPDSEKAFICHQVDHWFSIRKVEEEWYNFDSLYAAPQHISKFYLSEYLDSLKGFGWTLFLVRGDFPSECPQASSEAPNKYGQWLTPEEAELINSFSPNSTASPQDQFDYYSDPDEEDSEMLSETDEDDDLNAAIAISLMDTSADKANNPMINAGMASQANSSSTEGNAGGTTNSDTENLNDSPTGLNNAEAATPEKANQK